MARVTVEDCIEKIPNRFELVMAAARRSRDLSLGAKPTLERDRDKNPVVALREIADEALDLGQLNRALIRSLQKHAEDDNPEEQSQVHERLKTAAAEAVPQGRMNASNDDDDGLDEDADGDREGWESGLAANVTFEDVELLEPDETSRENTSD